MIDCCMNRLHVKRGSELPQSKLTESDVVLIRSIVEDREAMKARLRELTNAKLAEKFGVSNRMIDRITSGESWIHV